MCLHIRLRINMKAVKLEFTTLIWAFVHMCWWTLRFIAQCVSMSMSACHLCVGPPTCMFACVYSPMCLHSLCLCIFERQHMCFHLFLCECVRTRTTENIKMPWTVVSAYGRSHPHTGPALQIDRNEIFCNLNVNGSEIYRSVLCNYQCHNLLELCLCKVESKKERPWGREGERGKNKENKWESVEGLSEWVRDRMIYI